MKQESERGRCPVYLREEDAKDMLLKCPETKDWREDLVCSKWLNINEDMACRKIISCTNVTKTKTIGQYYLKLHVSGDQSWGGGVMTPPSIVYLEAEL
jgi:hypothetical protein